MRAEGDPQRGGRGGVPGCTWDGGRGSRGDPGASPGPENGRRVGAQRGAGLPPPCGTRCAGRAPQAAGSLRGAAHGCERGVLRLPRKSRARQGTGGSARTTARFPPCCPRGHVQVPPPSGPSRPGTAPGAVTVLWEGALRPRPTPRSSTAAAQLREGGLVPGDGVGRCSHAPPRSPIRPRAPPPPEHRLRPAAFPVSRNPTRTAALPRAVGPERGGAQPEGRCGGGRPPPGWGQRGETSRGGEPSCGVRGGRRVTAGGGRWRPPRLGSVISLTSTRQPGRAAARLIKKKSSGERGSGVLGRGGGAASGRVRCRGGRPSIGPQHGCHSALRGRRGRGATGEGRGGCGVTPSHGAADLRGERGCA